MDRRLGDNEDFKRFVRKAHEAGIRVVVDGVFNHTGREFFAFQDIQKNREQSPYCSWYKGVNFGWNSLIMTDLIMRHGEIALNW